MNIDINKLEKEIKDYKANFFSSWNDEKYKWEAVKCFQINWDVNSDNFAGKLVSIPLGYLVPRFHTNA